MSGLKARASLARKPRHTPAPDRLPRRRALIPRTLIDASTRAGAAAGLQVMAGAMRGTTSCWASIVMRFAQQIADSYTEAQAVANYTTSPTWTDTLQETQPTDPAPQDRTPQEGSPSDHIGP